MDILRKILHYLPRALTVAVVAFFYLFVLEAFSPEFGWQSGLAHFIAATVVLLIGILAWKKPKIGGWLFFLPLVISIVGGRLNPIYGALAGIGALYLIDGHSKKPNTASR